MSRIAGLLAEGSVVSTPRHHTGVVITEWGAYQVSSGRWQQLKALLIDLARVQATLDK